MADFLIELDLAQVESRIVYMLTRDPQLVAEAQSNPWEHNMHEENAKLIFSVEKSTAEQYYLGKKGVHGAQRGMQGKTLSEHILKDSNGEVVMLDTECQWIIDKYFESKPAIREVYFREVREEIWAKRMLTNSWGREAYWPYARFDEALYRELYSWRPQSDAADLINQQGIIPVFEFLEQNKMQTRLLAQIHDAALLTTTLEEAYDVASCFKSSIEVPVQYPAGLLSVPCSVKIGLNWKGYHTWKRFPDEAEFKLKVTEMLEQ